MGAAGEWINLRPADIDAARVGNDASNIPELGLLGNSLNEASTITPRVPNEPV